MNEGSTVMTLLSDQQPQALQTQTEGSSKGGAFLGLPGSIASTDGKLLADVVLITLETTLN